MEEIKSNKLEGSRNQSIYLPPVEIDSISSRPNIAINNNPKAPPAAAALPSNSVSDGLSPDINSGTAIVLLNIIISYQSK